MADEVLRRPSTPDADNAINKRAERRKGLERLSGFSRLTPRQQDIIIASMYMQDLANRGQRDRRFASASTLQETIMCHKSVQNLEYEKPVVVSDDTLISSEFFLTEDAYKIARAEDHVRRVKAFGYPCVVMFREKFPDNEKGSALHTLVVLGEGKKGEIVAWNKDSVFPFEILRLRTVIAEYDEEFVELGIRKVRCPVSAERPEGVIEPEKPSN